MRHGIHYVVAFLVPALFLVTAPAGSQESVERPTYTTGDFWAYDLELLTPLDLPDNMTAEVLLAGTSTVTIQGSEMRNIGGAVRSVIRATHALRASAVGSASLTSSNDTTNATFSALASADETVYLDAEGLEVWERHTEFTLNVSADLEVSPGASVTTSIDANGTVDMVLNYTTNNWDFPLTVGQKGEEGFSATGTSFTQLTFLDNTSSTSTPLAFNGTSSFEALREETIAVPAGTFATVVVANTLVAEGATAPTNVSTLAYWSGVVGAPVRYAVTNETGEEQVELVLTGYRYQAAEPLTEPMAPLSLQATPGDGQVVLTWQPPADDGGSAITNYKVYRRSAPGAATFLADAGTGLSYTDTTVMNDQTYYYQVSAVNGVGEGPLSTEASATPTRPEDMIKPTANAGEDQTTSVGTTVSFDASGSSDNVAIVSYEWDFGDGTTGTGQTTTHIYTDPGTYTVTLTVRDAAGNTDTDSLTVTVEAEPFQISPLVVTFAVIGVVVAAAGVAALLILRSRGKRKG